MLTGFEDLRPSDVGLYQTSGTSDAVRHAGPAAERHGEPRRVAGSGAEQVCYTCRCVTFSSLVVSSLYIQ